MWHRLLWLSDVHHIFVSTVVLNVITPSLSSAVLLLKRDLDGTEYAMDEYITKDFDDNLSLNEWLKCA